MPTRAHSAAHAARCRRARAPRPPFRPPRRWRLPSRPDSANLRREALRRASPPDSRATWWRREAAAPCRRRWRVTPNTASSIRWRPWCRARDSSRVRWPSSTSEPGRRRRGVGVHDRHQDFGRERGAGERMFAHADETDDFQPAPRRIPVARSCRAALAMAEREDRPG